MNIEKRIKEELLEAAGKTEGAEALVLLIDYDERAATNIIGGGGNVLSLLTKGLEHALSCVPDELEKATRMKIAQMILGGGKDASE